MIRKEVIVKAMDGQITWIQASGKPIGDFRKRWKTACRTIGQPDLIVRDRRRSGVKHACAVELKAR